MATSVAKRNQSQGAKAGTLTTKVIESQWDRVGSNYYNDLFGSNANKNELTLI